MSARVAIFVSGGGTNLQAILDARARGEMPHCEIALVASVNPDAYALVRAQSAGVPARAYPRLPGEKRADAEKKLLKAVLESRIELIVLAGFLTILSPAFIEAFPGKIINVHPALIPAFCGKGFYGLKVHEAALARGVKVTGATVHFVNEIPDGGEIIAQKSVNVLPGDTPEALQQRVMREAEWILLPRATEDVCRAICERKNSI